MTGALWVLVWALLGLSSALVCPDGGMCEDRNTCCENTEGGYGCCPLPHAECCSDHLHCCFQGTLCDLVHERCVNKSVSLPWVRRVASRPAKLALKAVVCPDQKAECPDDTTCCQLLDSSWGCCPLAKAVCCEDKLHCCPENTTCDVTHSRCVSASLGSVPLLKKIPARPVGSVPLTTKTPATPSNVVCPDRKSVCPDETTCCQMTNGTYGCCPMPSAVCCSDRIHCCPAGTQCDVQHNTCVSAPGIEPVTSGMVSVTQRGASVPCNDSVACADGSTCCKSLEGEWACCPLPKAVCCEDHLHCCPHATICNLAASTCDDPSGAAAATPLLAKTPAFPLATGENSKCDKSTSCPGKSTCCRTPIGGWACCPLPQAVCCEDHTHCCPHATICNLEAETCDDPSGSSPSVRWVKKTPAVTTVAAPNEKCDGQTMCPGGTTCCQKDEGEWACCPLPQAVCCDDHAHCCPKGYRCNVAERTCDKPSGAQTPWLLKVPALKEAEPRLVGGEWKACDGRSSCPRDTTCCFMKGVESWGCCPLPDAVCCADGDHCCPSGHTCDAHRGSCSRGRVLIPWFSKLSSRTETDAAAAAAVNDVKCDDKSSCASGATCCKLPSGEWGCCPLVKAVCCADHEHCCPQGYTCNMESGTCEKKGVVSLPQSSVLRSTPPPAPQEEEEPKVPCDGSGAVLCSRKETCCRTAEAEWGCCPSPGAVCCSGSGFCCPAGFRCDLPTGGCIPNAAWTWNSLASATDRDSAL
ncbi:unnamed protein product [Ophioblennius macclurei]